MEGVVRIWFTVHSIGRGDELLTYPLTLRPIDPLPTITIFIRVDGHDHPLPAIISPFTSYHSTNYYNHNVILNRYIFIN